MNNFFTLVRIVSMCLFQFQEESNLIYRVTCTGIIILVKETSKISPVPPRTKIHLVCRFLFRFGALQLFGLAVTTERLYHRNRPLNAIKPHRINV